jgi:hypothetical protein
MGFAGELHGVIMVNHADLRFIYSANFLMTAEVGPWVLAHALTSKEPYGQISVLTNWL